MNDDYRSPGQLIEALLYRRGWTQRVLSIVVGVDETVINKIVQGKRRLGADLALLLADVFDVPAETQAKPQESAPEGKP